MPARLSAVTVGSPAPRRTAAWYRGRLRLPGSRGVFDAGGVQLVIAYRPAAALRSKEPTRLVTKFFVGDVFAMEAWLVATETTWVRELELTTWGRIGTVLDPDGNYVPILEGKGGCA